MAFDPTRDYCSSLYDDTGPLTFGVVVALILCAFPGIIIGAIYLLAVLWAAL